MQPHILNEKYNAQCFKPDTITFTPIVFFCFMPKSQLSLEDIASNTRLLNQAILEQDYSKIEELLPVSEPLLDDSRSLLRAVSTGNVDLVKRLIPLTNPKDNEQDAFDTAIYWDYRDIIEALLPFVDPKAYGSHSLVVAVQHASLDTLNRLLELTDPKANNSEALRVAADYQDAAKTLALIPVSDFDAACNELNDMYSGEACEFLQAVYVDYQRTLLNEHLKEEYSNSTTSHKRKL